LLRGREVECSDGSMGIAQGVDGSGALLVHTAAGLRKISSAEVSVRPAPQSP
jgi:BirA family biotin operon repressor/biotin-[acetyl-CoA-carboxylase] ligase